LSGGRDSWLDAARYGVAAVTKLSDLGSPSKQFERIDPWEEGRFLICPSCGQAVDIRDIRQVAWHGRPGHKALDMDS